METAMPNDRKAQIMACERELADLEAKLGKDHGDICTILDCLAELYMSDGIYAKAALVLKRCLDIRSKQKEPDTFALAQALRRLSFVLILENKFSDAESLCERSLTLAEGQGGRTAGQLAATLKQLAYIANERGDAQRAESFLERVSSALQEAGAAAAFQLSLTEYARAILYRKQGKDGEALNWSQKAATLIGSEPADAGSRLDRQLAQLIAMYFVQERQSETEILLRQFLLGDLKETFQAEPLTAAAWHERAELFQAQGRFLEADELFLLALASRKQVGGFDHPQVATTALCLASMYLSQKRYAEAEPLLKQALQVRVRALGVEHPAVAACLESYVCLLKATQRAALALKLDTRAREIRSRLVLSADRAAAIRS